MFEYRARTSRVIDGDTIEVVLDLGFYVEHRVRIRVEDLNTPEVRGIERPDGLKAAAFVQSWLQDCTDRAANGWPLWVTTGKGKSFDRWVGSIREAQPEQASNDLAQAVKDWAATLSPPINVDP